MRDARPRWGPRTIRTHLANEGTDPLPGRSSIYRALVRHRRIDPERRKRKRSDYVRWERSRSMELWQMDIVGRLHLKDGTEVKIVTGVDDHSRFCVCARIVARATARPVCDALVHSLSTHGVPDQILTDNGKVFTARFGSGPGPVLFDRICHNNGIRHLLTAPFSPTTTGKVERFHKTMREDWFSENDFVHATIADAQASLDTWVRTYNLERPHQSLGDRPPNERFSLALVRTEAATDVDEDVDIEPMRSPRPSGVGRWVDQKGFISLNKERYRVGPNYAGEPVDVVVRSGLVEILHAGVLVATHAERRRPGSLSDPVVVQQQRQARLATTGLVVLRMVDGGGTVSFAATGYRVGRSWRNKQVEVAIVAGSVQISSNGKVIRVHAIRHDRSKEHAAFASPKGRPRKKETA